MKKIRIGNDIRIEWTVELPEGINSLDELRLAVEVRPSGMLMDLHECVPQRRKELHTMVLHGGAEPCSPPRNTSIRQRPVLLPHYIEDGKVVAIWPAERQFATGDYDILMYANKGDAGQGVVDQCRFVRLVAHSSQAEDCDCDCVQAVIELQPVTLSLSGLSAYEIAVRHGFEGTEEEWLATLSQDSKDAAAEVKALAEEFTSHPTKMGDNGNWWAWDMDADEYYDTGILAKGSVLYPTFYVDYTDMSLYMVYQDTTNEGLVSVDDEGYLCLNTTQVSMGV